MFGSKIRWIELTFFLVIVGVGVGSRLWLIDWPNFKPVAALCLFAGFVFSRYMWAVAACVCMLMISDWQLGGYPWQLALAVYGSMVFACSLGWVIKKRTNSIPTTRGLNSIQLGGFLLSSLTMSTVFFLSSNLAVWQFCNWYQPGIGGLIDCFSAAIPFYRWTLMGDLTFTVALAGCYQIVSLSLMTANYCREDRHHLWGPRQPERAYAYLLPTPPKTRTS